MDKYLMLEEMIIYYAKGNKALFSRLLGVKPQTINTWMSRNTFDAELIYSKCESISGDWLLSGEGEMLKNNQNVDSLQITNGSAAAVNVHAPINAPITSTNNSGESAVLQERVKLLEQLLEEKERLIKVLMEK